MGHTPVYTDSVKSAPCLAGLIGVARGDSPQESTGTAQIFWVPQLSQERANLYELQILYV